MPLHTLLDVDTLEEILVLVDVGDHAARDVDGHGALALRAFRLVLNLAAHGHGGHAEHVCQMLDLDLIVDHVGTGDHHQARPVCDQLDPVAVEDASARRDRRDGACAVELRLLGILVRRHQLHGPQSGEEHANDASREDGEAGEARLEALLGRVVAAARRAGRLAADVEGESRLSPVDQYQQNERDQNDGQQYGDDDYGVHLRP